MCAIMQLEGRVCARDSRPFHEGMGSFSFIDFLLKSRVMVLIFFPVFHNQADEQPRGETLVGSLVIMADILGNR